MVKNIVVDIPVAWECVRSVRQQVESTLAVHPEELRSAAVMVASELLENAIKYGVAVSSLTCTRFCFEMTAEYIEIQVSNGLTDATSVEMIEGTLKQMQSEESCEQLYMARLQELVNNPLQSNRLGLYRIGYEGKFTLTCTYSDQVLTMTAWRSVL